MKKIDVEQLKVIQLDILKYVDQYCKENGIRYWLDFGTLIGAIRHKGFIPWDDDIDIGMMRQDFDKFLKGFNRYSKRYKLICYENCKGSPWTFAKVVDKKTKLIERDMASGFSFYINIDIFIYDNAPEEDLVYQKMFKKLRLYQILNAHQTRVFKPHGNIQRRTLIYVIRTVLPLFPKGYFAACFSKLCRKYNSSNAKKVVCYSTIRKPIEKKYLEKIELCPFEDGVFPIPAGYDAHLRNEYTIPYKELPPEEQRVNTHFFEAYVY